jgi:HlyD family secretion protein
LKKKLWIALGIVAVLLLIFVFFGGSKDDGEAIIEVKVKSGSFKVEVNTTGELQAENSTKILGPSGLRMIRIWNVKISSLIPEGSVVDSGEWVATLDKTEATDKLKDIESEIEVKQTRYTNSLLDTTLELRGLRDNLINLEYALEESKIKLEQSKFEPPATIRQEEINLSKAKRTFAQALESYKVKVEQANAKMQEVNIQLNKELRNRENVAKVLGKFEVMAPKPGMVIYKRDWNGNKLKEGGQINAWDPVVAELPDLSQMMSKTFVNEIDISKVSEGQVVSIGVDAFPELQFDGVVTSVANIGEQLPGGDAKVFEVLIKMNSTDSLLKPAMTTNNSILISAFESVLSLPIEAVFGNDSINWVYQSAGLSQFKQQVMVGVANENEIIIEKGLIKGDVVMMSVPEKSEKLELKSFEEK